MKWNGKKSKKSRGVHVGLLSYLGVQTDALQKKIGF